MGRRADQTRVDLITAEITSLKALEANLRTYGDLELSQAVKRARRELEQPVVSGAINTLGVNADAVRK